MFIHRIESPGLAHWSYYLEDGGEAVVIDPRRDVAAYTGLARSRGARISTILETHRNEDVLAGSVELAARTGADIYHADGELDYEYGTAVRDGQSFTFGAFDLEALHTPGHTAGHMSYLVRVVDTPWMLFSGDLLFAGDAGRVDLGPPGSVRLYARDLYRSLHERVFPLGDHVILWPAHGPGSACGSAIADRPYTTIGVERALNPLLRMEEDGFVDTMVERSESIGRPPYFLHMERMNLSGNRFDERAVLPPLSPGQVEEAATEGALVIDTREAECYLAAHVPDSLAMPSAMIGQWAGSFADPATPVVLLSDDPPADVTELARMGFDDVRGYLGGGIESWEVSGRRTISTHTLDTPGVCHRLDEGAILRVLDVRSAAEVAALGIEGAHDIPLHELPERLSEIAEEEPVVIFCGSGRRSTIAASILERAGRVPEVVLGGTQGWSSGRCPLREVAPA